MTNGIELWFYFLKVAGVATLSAIFIMVWFIALLWAADRLAERRKKRGRRP